MIDELLRYNGYSIEQEERGNISMSMDQYVQEIKPIRIIREFRK